MGRKKKIEEQEDFSDEVVIPADEDVDDLQVAKIDPAQKQTIRPTGSIMYGDRYIVMLSSENDRNHFKGFFTTDNLEEARSVGSKAAHDNKRTTCVFDSLNLKDCSIYEVELVEMPVEQTATEASAPSPSKKRKQKIIRK